MNRRVFYLLGLLAPLLFVFTAILGGALRPGYSHVTNTVSELFSPGSPNRLLLTVLHTLYAVSFSLFGLGLLRFVQNRGECRRIGIVAAFAFISVGILSILTATVFPQDAWGSAPTFAGEMHMIISGVIALPSVLYMLLFGVWFQRTGIATFFRTYSIAAVVAVVLATAWFAVSTGGPLMGISERAAILVGFQWTFVLAIVVLKND
jgi:Protein of unknown function (DUF998)